MNKMNLYKFQVVNEDFVKNNCWTDATVQMSVQDATVQKTKLECHWADALKNNILKVQMVYTWVDH